MFIPFVTVASYIFPDIINDVILIWRLFVCLYVGFLYFRRRLYTPADFYFFMSIIVVFVSTILNNGQIQNQFLRTSSVIGFIMMFKVCFHEDGKRFLSIISCYGGLICFATVLTMFIFHRPGEYVGGMKVAGSYLEYGKRITGNWYLLGLDNTAFNTIFPIQILMIINQLLYKKKINKIVMLSYVLVTIAYIYVNSSTAMICFLLGLILCYIVFRIDRQSKFWKRINYKKGIVFIVLFVVLIVVFRLQYIFEDLIVNLLGKSLTLTRRTEIWDNAIKMIFKKPILGIGLQSDLYNYLIFRINHVHNILLELLYEGGTISMVFFITGVHLYCRNIKPYKSHKISILLSGALIIYFIDASLDFYQYMYMPYSFFLLMERMEDLVNIYERKEKL